MEDDEPEVIEVDNTYWDALQEEQEDDLDPLELDEDAAEREINTEIKIDKQNAIFVVDEDENTASPPSSSSTPAAVQTPSSSSNNPYRASVKFKVTFIAPALPARYEIPIPSRPPPRPPARSPAAKNPPALTLARVSYFHC